MPNTYETDLDVTCPKIDISNMKTNTANYTSCLNKFQEIKKKLIKDQKEEEKEEKTEYAREKEEILKILNELQLERKYKLKKIQLQHNSFIFDQLKNYVPITYGALTIVSVCYYLSVLLLLFLFFYIFNINTGDDRKTFEHSDLL